MANKVYDLTGKKFGRWTVIQRSGSDAFNSAMWLCRCECGKESTVRGYALRYGHTHSCGCLQSEQVSRRNFKHGESRSKLYRLWDSMKRRCYDEKTEAYKNYGSRGITVCDEWLVSFESFRDWANTHGYKPGLTIDRIDNDKGYSHSNCRWTTEKVQSNNRRTNHILTLNDESHTISEWSDIVGISRTVLQSRISNGWSVERALTECPRTRRWWKRPVKE